MCIVIIMETLPVFPQYCLETDGHSVLPTPSQFIPSFHPKLNLAVYKAWLNNMMNGHVALIGKTSYIQNVSVETP
jgi:hypothetical protein